MNALAKKRNLGIFVLIIFSFILGFLTFYYAYLQQFANSNVEVGHMSCDYNGGTYNHLAIFMSADSCQYCLCSNGEVKCGDSVCTEADPADSPLSHFVHKDIPGFSMDYPSNWHLEIKEFLADDAKGFDSSYTNGCGQGCMGVRISNSVNSLEFIFNVAFDSNSARCSNRAEFTKMNDTWYRVRDEDGRFFYSPDISAKNYRVEGENEQNSTEPYWDEYPFSESVDKYRICEYGNGEFLDQYSPAFDFPMDPGAGVPILFTRIRMKGLPESESVLKQFDEVVTSIKGLKVWVLE